ncbi:ABC transporter substrate-binding protein [Brachybacterium sacelli]|uniref:Multiple sugar transport system substrate-binding protein n=1 Tax=Brachybacterium sacelli TaxID=173364 RepID=A0ABS4WW80_9MICO|nr:extracellular solute-binding protein [Brachybacterium sacelli]MBP2380401.1 multiple sugar transport system substrate-binding protein [Brachybacterium sacelli]
MPTRRTALALPAALAALTSLAACGPNSPGGAGGGDPDSMRFAWWGNPERDKLTRAALEAYQEVAPDLTISAEPGDWSGYWDKLATQVAGGEAPDVIQMDEGYLAEYASREILLDLATSEVDTSAFEQAALDAGRVEDGLFALNAGINAPVLLANPEVFETAGVDLPDDTTWTWEDLVDIATRLSQSTPEGTYGVQQFGTGGGPPLTVFLRQLGAERFGTDGVGYSAEQLQQWMEFALLLQDSGAAPPTAVAVEETGQSLDQSLFAVGRCGLQSQWSNQVVTLDASLGGASVVLRMPSMTGSAADAELWYKASMYFSVAATSPRQEEAVAFVDWLVNSPEAGMILLAERGVPANLDVREAIVPELTDSDLKAVDFIEAIAGELGDPPPITPPGGGAVDDALARHVEDVLFGRMDPAAASASVIEKAPGLLG